MKLTTESRSTPPAEQISREMLVARANWVSVLADSLLSAAKIAVGWFAGSQALLADGFHSLSDLGSDIMVLWISRHAHRDPDQEHPYGHARFETMGTVALGSILLLVAIGIAIDAAGRLIGLSPPASPGPLALWIAAGSIAVKEGLYWYTVMIARRVHSDLLRANAWHHRSDAASSVVVLLALIGVAYGAVWLDAAGAVVVAGMIGWMGGALVVRSMGELVDTGLGEDELARIRDIILAVDGVASLHLLRTRRMGGFALVDVHLLLADPRVTVSEGHQISEVVRSRVIADFPNVNDVMVHIDPEDDELEPSCEHLPLRDEVMQRIAARLNGVFDFPEIEDVRLHYLRGTLHIELVLPCSYAEDESRRAAIQDALLAEPGIGAVQLLYSGRTKKDH